jgi:serine/threonine protein kinase
MDLLEGEELKTLMAKRGAMKANEVLPLAQQICAALYCAHSRDIVHRDLKPSNIFVAGDDPPIVKVLDFGVAKLLGPQDDDTASTKSGVVVGTPLFLAPEQATGDHDRICPQTDIYALGVLMYWMLSGWPPFRQKTFAKLIADHISTEPKPLQEMRSDIPWAVASVVHRCLAKDPADRPRTALEVSEDFAAAIADGCEKTLDPLDPSKGPLDPESEDGAALRLRQQALTALSNGQRQPSTTATAPTVASTATARSREQTSRRLWLLLSIALVLGGGATAMLLMRNNNQDKIPSTAVSDAGVPGISKGVVVSVDAARRPVDLRAVTKAVDLVADAGPELTKRRPTRRKASTRRKSPPERSKSPTRRGKLGEGTVKVEF